MEIPTIFYTVVGILVVGNLANIVMLLVFIFKAGRFVEKVELSQEATDAKANRAHKRIDKETDERIEAVHRHETRYHPI